jgi:hypothetical protein
MRLLQSVLICLKQTKKPQYKFITPLLGLLLMLPGHATFRNLSRYRPYHERTCSRWYATDFDWVWGMTKNCVKFQIGYFPRAARAGESRSSSSIGGGA